MKEIPVRKIVRTRKEPAFPEAFNIRRVDDLLSGRDMVQELHRHDFFFILALEKGKGAHEIDFTSYNVADHTIFFMRPGQVHHLRLNAGSTGYLIGFQHDFYNAYEYASRMILREAASQNCWRVGRSLFGKLYALLTDIFREYSQKQERYGEVIKAALQIFFIELSRNRTNTGRRPVNNSTYAQERLDKFVELLETHYSTHKKVSDYAEMLNLSIYQLNAITKRALGVTCSRVIDEYIILESKRQLLATSNQINQIAYSLGYEDVSYFIRFFKKHTGHTPDVFRNNFK